MTTSRPVRIVYLHPSLGIGGAEELRLLTLRHLDRRRYDVRVCCPTAGGPIADEIAALGVPVDVLGRSDRTFDVGTTRAVYRYLRAHRPDILQTSLFRTNWHGRLAGIAAGVPLLIAEEHGLHDPAVRFFRYSPRLAPFFRRADRWLAGRTARILACSRAVAESIAADEGIPMGRFLVAHNAVEPAKVEPRIGRAAIRARLGYADDEVVVGAVSALTPVKGYPVLVRAFAAARHRVGRLRLLIVGDGPARATIEALAEELGVAAGVRLVGAQRALGDWLAAMDIFASASLSEGFGISFLEAMTARLPCVAFDLGGIGEVVVDGETGVLVRARDAESLSAALVALATDAPRRARLGAAGHARVQQAFTPRHYVDRLHGLYEDLAGVAGARDRDPRISTSIVAGSRG